MRNGTTEGTLDEIPGFRASRAPISEANRLRIIRAALCRRSGEFHAMTRLPRGMTIGDLLETMETLDDEIRALTARIDQLEAPQLDTTGGVA